MSKCQPAERWDAKTRRTSDMGTQELEQFYAHRMREQEILDRLGKVKPKKQERRA